MTRNVRFAFVFLLSALCVLSARVPAARQAPGPTEALHRPLDQILDVNVRDGFVYYRALRGERGRLDRYASSLNVAGRDVRGVAARAQDGVLGERLQCVRAADRHQQLSHPRPQRDVSREQHPADSGRVRADAPPRRGPQCDARRDREDDPARISRSRACLWRSAAGRSAAAGCGARHTPAPAWPSSSTRSSRSSSRSRPCCESIAPRAA